MNNLQDFEGWEFLQWQFSETEVEAVLGKMGLDFKSGNPNSKAGPVTKLEYNGMQTRLAYDAGHLYDVQQYKKFASGEKDDANVFYAALVLELKMKYGDATSQEDDKDIQKLRAEWLTKYTRVKLVYSYKGSENPLFESQAYTISLFTNPL